MPTFQKDFRRLQFQGFGEVGTCFLRVRVNPDETYIFLCAQLKNYTGTPITSVAEEVFVKAVSEVQKSGFFNLYRPHSYRLNFSEVVANTRWVEHYPQGTGRSSEDTYALVRFARDMNPAWEYVSLEGAATECSVEKDFFLISPEDLHFD